MTEELDVSADVDVTDQTGEAEQPETVESDDVEQVEAEQPEESPKEEPKDDDPIQKLEKQLKKEQRRINQRTARMYQAEAKNKLLMERLEALEKMVTPLENKRPQADQYESFDEYNEAVMDWKLKQSQPQEAQASSDAPPPQEAQWLQTRETEIVQQANQLAQHIPDFADSIAAAAEMVDAMPWQTRKTLYESQHPALAAYVLEKEGALEQLFNATPQQASALIAQATQIGVSNIKQWAEKPKTTSAPAPLSPNKAIGTGVKSEDRMSGAELLKKYGVS